MPFTRFSQKTNAALRGVTAAERGYNEPELVHMCNARLRRTPYSA